MTDYTRFMCISADVGSVFDQPDFVLGHWIREVCNSIAEIKSEFVALHLQHIGGKKNSSNPKLGGELFIRKLLDNPVFEDYSYFIGFVDDAAHSGENFTGLASVFFIKQVANVQIFDHKAQQYVPLPKEQIFEGDLNNNNFVKKARFPLQMCSEFKDSCRRKGFMKVSFTVFNRPFHFLNVHLFGETDNVSCIKQTSSNVYSLKRAAALEHVLRQFEPQFSEEAFFVGGNFNTRLNQNAFLKEFSRIKDAVPHVSQKSSPNGENSEVVDFLSFGARAKVISVSQKQFDLYDMHDWTFSSCHGQMVKKYNDELNHFRNTLFESSILFQPTYPYNFLDKSKNVYQRKACPSWTDRVTVNGTLWQLMKYDSYSSSSAIYQVIGQDANMGEHKPVYLYTTVALPKKRVPFQYVNGFNGAVNGSGLLSLNGSPTSTTV